MTWVKVEPGIFTHRKFRCITGQAKLMYFAALCYANAFETDGFLSDDDVVVVGVHANTREPESLIEQLVKAHLWEPGDAGYWIHDYEKYQPTRDRLSAEREANARRQREWRERHLTSGTEPPDPGGNVSQGKTNGVTPRRPMLPAREANGRHGTGDPVDLPSLRQMRSVV